MRRCNFIIITILILVLASCNSNQSDFTRLDSDNYLEKEDRIKKLTKEINASSKFEDAEFELFNVNGFNNRRTSAPGASSWDYKFVVKVNTLDIFKWTKGMVKTEHSGYDSKWTKEIVKQRSQNWVVHSKPQYFIRDNGNVNMVVFQQEGIIFKRIMNL